MNKKEALKSIERRMKRIQCGIDKHILMLEECRNFKEAEHIGTLLASHLNEITKNSSSITLFDWETEQERTISLDPTKPPKEQHLLYFAKMKKQKKALEHLPHIIERMKKELSLWQERISALQHLEQEEAIEEFIHTYFQKPNQKKEEQKKTSPFYQFRSASGCSILVGKDARSSMYVTFQKAKSDDLWLHIQGVSGPHVIVKKNAQGHIDHEALLDGAHLALYMSRKRSELEKEHTITYTLRKEVHHGGKRAKLGQVLLSKFQSIVIRLDPARIATIKERSKPN